VPLSVVGQHVLAAHPDLLAGLLGGGDDYEILCTVPPSETAAFVAAAATAGVPVQRIGQVAAGTGVIVRRANGTALEVPTSGWDHF
jgi:thiamine-monophosphate kinase